jgi:hypothetical protein
MPEQTNRSMYVPQASLKSVGPVPVSHYYASKRLIYLLRFSASFDRLSIVRQYLHQPEIKSSLAGLPVPCEFFVVCENISERSYTHKKMDKKEFILILISFPH